MFSALSFLPQTGAESDDGPEETDNVMITNQQKLEMFDVIVNEDGDKL